MIRSSFRVISIKDRHVMLNDILSGIDYNVFRVEEGNSISKDSVIMGRIHPFGNHYRFSGEIIVLDSSPEDCTRALMYSLLENNLKELEEMQFRPSTSFITIMKKYPAHWVDRMSRTYSIEKMMKNEKIEAILEKIAKDMDSIISGLSPEAMEILDICMKRGGYARMMFLGDFKEDTTDFLEKKSKTPLGELRYKGLLFLGRMKLEGRNCKVAFVPREIRESLEPYFPPKQKGTNRTLDNIFSWG